MEFCVISGVSNACFALSELGAYMVTFGAGAVTVLILDKLIRRLRRVGP